MNSLANHRAEVTSAINRHKLSAQENSNCEKLKVYRVVVGFLLASLLWKIRVMPMFYSIYCAIPLRDPFFPAIMQNARVLTALYCVPITLCISVLFIGRRAWLIGQSTITCLALAGLCLHQQSYNDVTFVTCFWTSLWCVWYSLRMNDPESLLLDKAGRLAILVLSLIFLGGAVGKLTPGYWSGEVLYQIYFVDRDYWFFNLIRGNFERDTVREIATYYSRIVIVVELSCGGLWLLPTRTASAIAMSVLLGIALFSNTYLFSVISCLLGLSIVGLQQPASQRALKPGIQFKSQSRPISKLIAE